MVGTARRAVRFIRRARRLRPRRAGHAICEQKLSLHGGTRVANLLNMGRPFPHVSDESRFWISMDAPETHLFCNPLEKLAGQRWHEVYSHGEWDVSQMLRDHAGALVH